MRRQDQERHLAAPGNHHDPAEVLDPGGLPGVRARRPGARAVGRPGRQAGGLRRRDRGDLRLLHRVPAGRVADEGVLRQSGSSQSRRPLHGRAPGAVDAEHRARPVRRWPRSSGERATPRAGCLSAVPGDHPSPVRRRGDESRPTAASGRRPEDGPPAGRKRACRRASGFPAVGVPAPRLLDRYISRIYLRIVGLSFMALLGLFYISTFIDKSDKIFKGQATTGTVAALLVYHDPAVRLLRHPDRGAAERAGDLRPAVARAAS